MTTLSDNRTQIYPLTTSNRKSELCDRSCVVSSKLHGVHIIIVRPHSRLVPLLKLNSQGVPCMHSNTDVVPNFRQNCTSMRIVALL
jgi:hypothetical protein